MATDTFPRKLVCYCAREVYSVSLRVALLYYHLQRSTRHKLFQWNLTTSLLLHSIPLTPTLRWHRWCVGVECIYSELFIAYTSLCWRDTISYITKCHPTAYVSVTVGPMACSAICRPLQCDHKLSTFLSLQQ